MWKDPIVEEIRKFREQHAAQFHYNLDAIFQDLKAKERESIQNGWQVVSLCPKIHSQVAEGQKAQKRTRKKAEGAVTA